MSAVGSRDNWRTAIWRFADLIFRSERVALETTGAVGGLAFRIVRVEAWASGPVPATTPAVSFRSDCTLALRDDTVGPRRSLLDWCRGVLRAG